MITLSVRTVRQSKKREREKMLWQGSLYKEECISASSVLLKTTEPELVEKEQCGQMSHLSPKFAVSEQAHMRGTH